MSETIEDIKKKLSEAVSHSKEWQSAMPPTWEMVRELVVANNDLQKEINRAKLAATIAVTQLNLIT